MVDQNTITPLSWGIQEQSDLEYTRKLFGVGYWIFKTW
jgi:hypothetical protein